jgi:hypothetical protein
MSLDICRATTKFIQDADHTMIGPQKLLEQAHEIKNNEVITLVKEYIKEREQHTKKAANQHERENLKATKRE